MPNRSTSTGLLVVRVKVRCPSSQATRIDLSLTSMATVLVADARPRAIFCRATMTVPVFDAQRWIRTWPASTELPRAI
jgi:hypothetical protein